MDLATIYNILDIVNIANIKSLALIKQEDGVVISGFDEEQTVSVHHFMSGNFIEQSMGIPRVQATLGRLNSFNLTTTTAEVVLRGDIIGTVNIKQGRRKLSMRFGDPDKIIKPSAQPITEIINEVVLSKEMIHSLSNAAVALNPKHVTLMGRGEDIIIEFREVDTSDNFVDVVGVNSGGDWSHSWKVGSFMRLLRQAAKDSDEVALGIGEGGFATIMVGDVVFCLIPSAM